MAFDDDAFLNLLDPLYAGKCRGILSGLTEGPMIAWKTFQSSPGSSVMRPMTFCPCGWGFSSQAMDSRPHGNGIHLHSQPPESSVVFCSGDLITCCGHIQKVSNLFWKCESGVTLSKRPIYSVNGQWDVVNFFAGGFAGWTHAFHLLPKILPEFCTGHQIHIDHDAEIAQVWTKRLNKPTLKGPLKPPTFLQATRHTAIHATVDDFTCFHVFDPQSNALFTGSPPCPTWSRGGRSAGIQDPQGFAFVDFIRMVTAGQPLFVGVECVDEIVAHDHFPFLLNLFNKVGYVCKWHRVIPLHQLAHVFRTRWLGVWFRADVNGQVATPDSPLRALKVIPWTAEHYNVELPRPFCDQLTLAPSEQKVYGNRDLLPAATKKCVAPSARVGDVLSARIADPKTPLPTLCARYGSQHLLPAAHLQAKGVFAVLVRSGPRFRFVDPVKHIALLGATDEVVFSAKAPLAYQQIGNAISVPQALLVLLSGVAAIMHAECDLQKAILSSWHDRVTSFNGLIIADGQFLIVCKKSQVLQELRIEPPQVESVMSVSWTIVSKSNGLTKEIVLPASWSTKDACSIFAWKHDIGSQVFLRHEDFPSIMRFGLEDLALIVRQCDLCLAGTAFAEVSMSIIPCEHVGHPGPMSSTQAFTSRLLKGLAHQFGIPPCIAIRCTVKGTAESTATKVPCAWTLTQIVEELSLAPSRTSAQVPGITAGTMFEASSKWVLQSGSVEVLEVSAGEHHALSDVISPTVSARSKP